uniref:PRA1 family protein n=1 Tax=Davidia involucrata TaxID=16924 RepID=A0A5B6YY48_DAVIN
MVFSSNPLSLSVPEPAFESWLRDSGYLEILDQRTSDLHRLTSSSTSTPSSSDHRHTATSTNSATTITNGFFLPAFSYLGTLLSLFTLNPFAKLTTDDFSGETPSWTLAFIGFCDSYSFPSSPSQARLRVHENVKRYARNYASLFILFFACSLYQMPLALVGLISSLALWDLFRFCGDRWGLDRYPVILQSLGITWLAFHRIFSSLREWKKLGAYGVYPKKQLPSFCSVPMFRWHSSVHLVSVMQS